MELIEQWELEPYYIVELYSNGEVKVISNSPRKKGQHLIVVDNGTGYKQVKVNGKIKYIHHLVCEKFIGHRPEGLVVDHVDSNKENNLPSNLEYVTQKENIRRSCEAGTHIKYRGGVSKDMKSYRKLYRDENREKHKLYMKKYNAILRENRLEEGL